MLKRCIMCKGKLEKKKVDYTVAGVNIGKFVAMVCKCGEQYFDELTARKMTELTKKAGVFEIAKKTTIGYSGKSLMVRIPKEIVEFTNLKIGEEVVVTPQDKNKILVEVKK